MRLITLPGDSESRSRCRRQLAFVRQGCDWEGSLPVPHSLSLGGLFFQSVWRRRILAIRVTEAQDRPGPVFN
jgi:hypothetical protein